MQTADLEGGGCRISTLVRCRIGTLVRGVIRQTAMMQHSVITLYQDRDELIQEAAVSLASPELTVILLTRPTSFRG